MFKNEIELPQCSIMRWSLNRNFDTNKVYVVDSEFLDPSIIEKYIDKNDWFRKVSEGEKPFEKLNCSEKLFVLSAIKKCRIITNREGIKTHRQVNIKIARTRKWPIGNGILGLCCNLMIEKFCQLLFKSHPYMDSMNQIAIPTVIFTLGGAEKMGEHVKNKFLNSLALGKNETLGWQYRNYNLQKIVEEDRLVGFRFREDDLEDVEGNWPDLSNYCGIVLDDAIDTGTSFDVFMKTIPPITGVRMIGAGAIFNQYGEDWDIDVPIKFAMVNLPFKKYYEEDCPQCN